ncbi:MAG: type 2 lantipeptide synthetase LanM family protein [SAR324 cluster bacterium]|nr:type 2 lantipeptide synthetase LanM family protein [SAR324 cluster bacterium]
MHQDKIWLQQIYQRTLSTTEWANLPDSCKTEPVIDQDAQALLERWQKLVMLGEAPQGAFDARLEQLGLTHETALKRLGKRTLSHDVPLAEWLELLGDVLDQDNFDKSLFDVGRLNQYSEEEIKVLGTDKRPVFAECLVPWLQVAWNRIAVKHPDWDQWLSEEARYQVMRYLLFRLSGLASRTFSYEIKRQQSQLKVGGDTAEARYDYYMTQVLGKLEGQKKLFEQYPVLARLLSTSTLLFLNHFDELLTRWKADYSAVLKHFNFSAKTPCIKHIIMGLSDPHNGGKTVCFIDFGTHNRIVYKPRSMKTDEAFYQLEEWINKANQLPALKTLKLLARKNYGWCEFVKSQECVSETQVANYYARQGIHLALFYFLCGIDFHHQNFIAHGEFPVPIDLEGLCAPGMHVMPPHSPGMPSSYQLLDFSLVATTMLPRWRAGDYDRALYLDSGIDGSGSRLAPLKRPKWYDLRKDTLRLGWDYSPGSGNESRPSFKGKLPSVQDHIPELLNGFERAYRFILEHKQFLLKSDSPLSKFKNVTSRWLNRDTQIYYDLLFWASAPDQLVSGLKYDIALEMMAHTAPVLGNRVSLMDDEKQSLWKQDIPVYYAVASQRRLISGSGSQFPGALTRGCFSQICQRLKHAGEEDMNWQKQLVKGSFALALQAETPPPAVMTGPGAENKALESRFLDYAVRIGKALEAQALESRGGHCWLGLQRLSQATGYVEYVRLVPWLYSGTSGIAVFLMNLYRATNENRFRDLAVSALNYGNHALQWTIDHGGTSQIPLSGFNGLGSVIYTLTEAGRLLGQQDFTRQALRLSELINEAMIEKTQDPDVLNGSSGTLLALIHLYHHHPAPSLRMLMASLVKNILARQTGDGDTAGWIVPINTRPLLGMAHGASGIAYALSRYYALTQEETVKNSIMRGLAYEQQHFSESYQDWPNLQAPPGQLHFMTGWCAGAPGAGLARLGLLEAFPDHEGLQNQLRSAVTTTIRYLRQPCDHLCCGDTSRIILLMEAGKMLANDAWKNQGEQTLASMMEFYEKEGYLRLQNFFDKWIIPDLMIGISGVGMTLLQACIPENISRVLMLK